jgi:RNA polymerase sigma-70 factor (ECF subfamily)
MNLRKAGGVSRCGTTHRLFLSSRMHPPHADCEPDLELMLRVRQRDADAFAALLARHRERVQRRLRALVRDEFAAADLTQEVFLRVWTHAEQWHGQGDFGSWLFRIATNLALNHLRTLDRRREQPLERNPGSYAGSDREGESPAERMVDTAAPAPDRWVEHADRMARLRRLVELLPEEKRAVFRMVHEEELELREVAGRLGIPEGTVKSRLHHARKRLARAWQEAEELDP